jgi:uncharacterized protein
MAGRSIAVPDQADEGRARVPLASSLGAAAGATFLSIRVITLLSLIGLTISELVTVFVNPGWGALCHATLAGTTIALAALVAYQGSAEGQLLGELRGLEANLLVALALPSLLRLVSLAMPQDELSRSALDGAVTLCLLGATWAAMRANGYSWREAKPLIHWSRSRLHLDLFVASTGVIIGQVEYHVWQPEGLIDGLALNQMVIGTLVVIAVAGIAEELMLRGVIQVAGSAVFGYAVGITVVAAVFAILHMGYRSWLDVAVAFSVAVWLGLAVRVTGSLVGASLAHGIANVCLFVAFPLLLQ